MEGSVDGGGLDTVDLGFEDAGVEDDLTDDLVASLLGIAEGSSAGDVVVATAAEVVDRGGVPLDLNNLAGSDGLESGIGKIGIVDVDADTGEGDLADCSVCQIMSRRYQKRFPFHLPPSTEAVENWAFSTGDPSRIEPALRTLRGVLPVLVMLAFNSLLPTCSTLTSRGPARLPRLMAAPLARAARQETTVAAFIVNTECKRMNVVGVERMEVDGFTI